MKKEKLLKAIYRGELPIGDLTLDCAVLEDSTRVISANSIFAAFDRPSRGPRKMDQVETEDGGVLKLPPFLASKKLIPLINEKLLKMINPIEYLDGERKLMGYKAEILPAMCHLYLDAKKEGILQPSQEKLAEQSEILQRSFANVGIVGLVDEATGYQHNRGHSALRILLEKYIQEEARKWLKEFPDSFFKHLDRLYENPKTTSRKRPLYYGNFINKYVYKPMEGGYVLEDLNRVNPVKKSNSGKIGYRDKRNHQHLTGDLGLQQLRLQLGGVLAIMKISPNIRRFKENFEKTEQLTLFGED